MENTICMTRNQFGQRVIQGMSLIFKVLPHSPSDKVRGPNPEIAQTVHITSWNEQIHSLGIPYYVFRVVILFWTTISVLFWKPAGNWLAVCHPVATRLPAGLESEPPKSCP